MNKKQPGDKGSIYNSLFDDHYFAEEDGLAESRYIFLEHNQLTPQILKKRNQPLLIAELGFGTGLNFLLLWQAVAKVHPQLPITFYSVEKYPLLPEAMVEALLPWPGLEPLLASFLPSYASSLKSYYKDHNDWLCFSRKERSKDKKDQAIGFIYQEKFDNLQLTLFLGDVQGLFYHLPPQVDAWFLDGFAPAKNPEMWSKSLLKQVGQWTKSGGRFATFTAAGVVRQRLQQAGFVVEKGKGFGRKRHMLFGYKPQCLLKIL